MGIGYGKRRTHRQQIRYERWMLLLFTLIGLVIAAGAAALALSK
jgi:hypothetical protein